MLPISFIEFTWEEGTDDGGESWQGGESGESTAELWGIQVTCKGESGRGGAAEGTAGDKEAEGEMIDAARSQQLAKGTRMKE